MSERGVAAVEFALVAPLLVFLLFAIIEFSLVLYDKAVITNATREGARFGSVHDPSGTIDNAAIKNVVNNYLNNKLISLGSSSTANVLDPQWNTPAPGFLTVTANYTYDFLVLPNFGSMDTSINLSATTVMKVE
jgi:Flp pilus assembly protein TadG